MEQAYSELAFHLLNVQKISEEIGFTLGLSYKEIEILRMGAAVHDVGKFEIPYEILNKSISLSKSEWDIMRKHPELGAKKLKEKRFREIIVRSVLHHHERWDGNGYPGALKGTDIPVYSRIILIADAYDVMVSKRSYKEPVSSEAAINEIIKCSGQQFDPEIVDVFVNIITCKRIAI